MQQKTIKPVDVGGRAGGEKYIVLNILFKVKKKENYYGEFIIYYNDIL